MKSQAIIADPIRLRRRLLQWYDLNRRPLPWRETRDPYAVWISEIMLQQTQVKTVVPYFLRFLDRYPTVEALARAPVGDVLKTCENLGYYARARNIHRAAGVIMERHGGRIPGTREELLRLPGIGPYTAGAILSIAFGRDVAAVDGNVRRVASRLFGITEPIDDAATGKRIEAQVQALVPKHDPGRFNQALMELGAVCCKPRFPSCPSCPLRDGCRARAGNFARNLPVRRSKKTIPHREVVAAIIRDGDGRALIVQRPSRGLLGALWKFPGGILAPREARKEGLRRIVREELGIEIGVGMPLVAVKHAYTHFRITLTPFSCTLESGSPFGPPWRWAGASDAEALPFSGADRRIARAVFSGDRR